MELPVICTYGAFEGHVTGVVLALDENMSKPTLDQTTSNSSSFYIMSRDNTHQYLITHNCKC